MLSVANKPIMRSVFMLSVVAQNKALVVSTTDLSIIIRCLWFILPFCKFLIIPTKFSNLFRETSSHGATTLSLTTLSRITLSILTLSAKAL